MGILFYGFSWAACADRFSLLKWKGGRGVFGQLLPTKKGYPSGIDSRSIPAKHSNNRDRSSNTRVWSFTFLAYRKWASTSAGYTRSSTSSRRFFRHQYPSSYQVTVVYTRAKPIHTSGLGVGSASWGGALL